MENKTAEEVLDSSVSQSGSTIIYHSPLDKFLAIQAMHMYSKQECLEFDTWKEDHAFEYYNRFFYKERNSGELFKRDLVYTQYLTDKNK